MLAASWLAALVPLGSQATTFDEEVELADVIVVARVEALHALKGAPVKLVELVPEQTLLGPTRDRLFAFPTLWAKGEPNLANGKTYVLFLHEAQPELTKEQAEAAEALKHDAPIYVWYGSWPVTSGHVLVPAGELPATDRPKGLVNGKRGDEVGRDELVAWLEPHARASLPSIRVWNTTNGGAPKEVRFWITPDGTIHGRGATKVRLDPAELRALNELLASARFEALPERVGPVVAEGREYGIELHTEKGRKSVRISIDGDAEHLSQDEREATERALRILRALPVPDLAGAPAKK